MSCLDKLSKKLQDLVKLMTRRTGSGRPRSVRSDELLVFTMYSQWRIHKSGIRGIRKVGVQSGNFLEILCKNNAFSCKIFTCFKMHPVNRRGGASLLNPPLGTVRTYKTRCEFSGAYMLASNFLGNVSAENQQN